MTLKALQPLCIGIATLGLLVGTRLTPQALAQQSVIIQQHGPGVRMAPPRFPLLMTPDVQKELKLSPKQLEKVNARIKEVAEDDGGGRRRIVFTSAEGPADFEKDLLALLEKDQKKRFEELYLQEEGLILLMEEKFVKEVGITKEQQTKLDEILESHDTKMQELYESATPDSDHKELMVKITKQKTETNKKLLDLLTLKQKEKWTTMQGKKFERKRPTNKPDTKPNTSP